MGRKETGDFLSNDTHENETMPEEEEIENNWVA
jgi:hypothetical protein